jgi:thiol:disulfide interchange protein DsbD
MTLRLPLVASVAALALPTLFAQDGGPEGGNAYVSVALALETTNLVRGEESQLWVTFKIKKGWHLYWRNSGDTGMPIDIELDLPDGITAGDPIWPVPERHESEGDLLDYIYEDEVTLIYPLRVGTDATGDSAQVRATVDFLVCDEVCVPGFAKVDASFPIGDSEGAASGDAELFERARARWARPMKERGRDATPLSAAWSGGSLVIEARGADELTFFPYETPEAISLKRIEPESPIQTCHAMAGRLEMPYSGDVRKLKRVKGVLDIRVGKAHEYVLIDLAPPEK